MSAFLQVQVSLVIRANINDENKDRKKKVYVPMEEVESANANDSSYVGEDENDEHIIARDNCYGSVCNSWSDDSDNETTKTSLVSPFDCNICLDAVTQPVVTRCGHLYCWPCLFRWLEPGMLPEEKEVLISASRTEPSSSPRPVFAGGARGVDSTRRCCPVCKAESSVAEIIPIYVRNNNDSSNSSPLTPTRSNCSRRKKRSKRKADICTVVTEEFKQEDEHPVPSRPLPPPPRPNALTSLHIQRINSSNNTGQPQHILPAQHHNTLDPSLHQSLFSALFSLQNQPYNSDNTMISPEDATSEFLSRLLLVLGSFVVLCLLIF